VTESIEDVVDGKVQGATQPELQKVEKLLDIEVFSNETQPEVENLCAVDNGGCRDLCVPTVVNGTASRTCFCQEGYELAGTACFKSYPATVIMVRQDSLQAVALDTETTSTILSGLTNATRLDFFATDDGDYLLFWLDDGGLFRGSWTPGGQVEDVQQLTPSGKAKRATDVVVEWSQRNVFWIENDNNDQMKLKVSSLLGTAIGTIYSDGRWRGQQALITQTEGLHIAFSQIAYGDLEVKMVDMAGKKTYWGFGSDITSHLIEQPTEWASDLSPVSNPRYERYFWAVNGDSAIDYVNTDFSLNLVKERLLTHPTLANTGGLDVFRDRIYWADGATNQLMSANSETGGDARAVAGTEGTSHVHAVRVVHPLKQPPTRHPVCDETSNGCSDMCQHMWVDWKSIGQCTCGDGRSLGADEKTCE